MNITGMYGDCASCGYKKTVLMLCGYYLCDGCIALFVGRGMHQGPHDPDICMAMKAAEEMAKYVRKYVTQGTLDSRCTAADAALRFEDHMGRVRS